MTDLARLRFFPLDGAALWFQPSTGLHLRAQAPRFARLERTAPRVVMFGITNACNLRCSFCSRDTTRPSEWTVDLAASVLRGLAQAGTLEVAFGGGEPLLFPGFPELLTELRRTTPLALHATSNGTRINAATWPRLRGLLTEVRLSLYDEPTWQAAADTMNADGQRWSANLLVDRARLPRLPALLAQLAARGCHDVALLPYLGVPGQALDAPALAELAATLDDAPLPCRISVCFGDRLAVPCLPRELDARPQVEPGAWPRAGGDDCGAGFDFITLTPDRRVQSCSFQDTSVPPREAPPVTTAEDVLRLWRAERTTLRQAAARSGCARRDRPPDAAPTPSRAAARWPALALWHQYSGNNSGECVLVGKFETNEAARRYVAELLPGLVADEPYSAAWRELFEREGVVPPPEVSAHRDLEWSQTPHHLLAIGRSVVATSYSADDAFPELRALTWKRGGYVVAGGLHLHDWPALLAVIRGRDSADARLVRDALDRAQGGAPPAHAEVHGDLVVSLLELTRDSSSSQRTPMGAALKQRAEALEQLAGERPLACEPLLEDTSGAALTAVMQRLGVELSSQPRLWVSFFGQDADAAAQRFASAVDQPGVHRAGHGVLIEGQKRRKRLAVLGLRHGGYVRALEGDEVEVSGSWWFLQVPSKGKKAVSPRVDRAALEHALTSSLGVAVTVTEGNNWRSGASASLCTREPATALAAMTQAASLLGCRLNVHVRDLSPLAFCVRRLIAEVRSPEARAGNR